MVRSFGILRLGKLLIQKCVESKMMNQEIDQTLRTAFDMLKRSSDVDSIFTLIQAIYDVLHFIPF